MVLNLSNQRFRGLKRSSARFYRFRVLLRTQILKATSSVSYPENVFSRG